MLRLSESGSRKLHRSAEWRRTVERIVAFCIEYRLPFLSRLDQPFYPISFVPKFSMAMLQCSVRVFTRDGSWIQVHEPDETDPQFCDVDFGKHLFDVNFGFKDNLVERRSFPCAVLAQQVEQALVELELNLLQHLRKPIVSLVCDFLAGLAFETLTKFHHTMHM